MKTLLFKGSNTNSIQNYGKFRNDKRSRRMYYFSDGYLQHYETPTGIYYAPHDMNCGISRIIIPFDQYFKGTGEQLLIVEYYDQGRKLYSASKLLEIFNEVYYKSRKPMR